MAFEKGNKLGGRKPGSKNVATKLKSFRTQLAELKVNIAREIWDLYRKTKDEAMKLELIKLTLQYSQVIPTTDLDEESADVRDISAATLLKLASGDTTIPTEPEPDAVDSDQDAICSGDSNAADALDAAENEGES